MRPHISLRDGFKAIRISRRTSTDDPVSKTANFGRAYMALTQRLNTIGTTTRSDTDTQKAASLANWLASNFEREVFRCLFMTSCTWRPDFDYQKQICAGENCRGQRCIGDVLVGEA